MQLPSRALTGCFKCSLRIPNMCTRFSNAKKSGILLEKTIEKKFQSLTLSWIFFATRKGIWDRIVPKGKWARNRIRGRLNISIQFEVIRNYKYYFSVFNALLDLDVQK